ncbi:twin-arginine translocase TatA/TatE family subunit [Kribbella sp. NPDC051770]|uniref:Sec-independent protein translocase subunit TatA/TatB n=1 Tax=Kribbella sp. NPDC051770 TaxID=3155413 RepID=UPI00341547C0
METLLALPEGGEWIVLLIVVVLLFGANRLPELTRNTAKALVELKKVTREAKLDPAPQELPAEERAVEREAPEPASDAPLAQPPSAQQSPPPTS